MTGTAVTEAEEFHKIYNLETVVIPTNRANVRRDFNDLIYRTEEDKFRAVIRDIKARNEKGQPVLVGTISIEKNEVLAEMMEREGLRPQILNAKNHQKEAEIIAQAGRRGAVTLATNMAGRGVDIILGGSPPEAGEQAAVRELGGLHVIGTERHESRRIDNQLRGRAGRQGDPGSSQFYVSTEDDLMRIFGGDRMRGLMQTLRVPADTPIENRMISRSIESAQKKVEGNNFDIRKHLVEYDDVINKHRTAIYRRRREILELAEAEAKEGDKTLSDIILEMVEGELGALADFHTASDNITDWNLQEIYETTRTIWPASDSLKGELDQIIGSSKPKEELRRQIFERLSQAAREKYTELAASFSQSGIDFKEIEKSILVRSFDENWVEHLETIDYLRRGIGLRGYGQRDPLVEYKKEAYRLFQDLNSLIQRQVAYSIFKTADALAMAAREDVSRFASQAEKKLEFSGAAKEMQRQSEARNTIDLVREKVRDESGQKVGRNDPCPCGSGKKYKQCCGK